jgi:hypothetical protein
MPNNQRPRLFEYAILYHPLRTKADEDEGREPKSQLLVQPTPLLANDQQEATLVAARQIPDAYLDKLSSVEIAIRPF